MKLVCALFSGCLTCSFVCLSTASFPSLPWLFAPMFPLFNLCLPLLKCQLCHDVPCTIWLRVIKKTSIWATVAWIWNQTLHHWKQKEYAAISYEYGSYFYFVTTACVNFSQPSVPPVTLIYLGARRTGILATEADVPTLFVLLLNACACIYIYTWCLHVCACLEPVRVSVHPQGLMYAGALPEYQR